MICVAPACAVLADTPELLQSFLGIGVNNSKMEGKSLFLQPVKIAVLEILNTLQRGYKTGLVHGLGADAKGI